MADMPVAVLQRHPGLILTFTDWSSRSGRTPA